MTPDPFEQQLQQRPLPQLPPEWRTEILGAATAARMEQERTETSSVASVSWKHIHWGALAAVWVAIGLISVLEPEPEGRPLAIHTTPVDLERRWQEHLRLLAEWAEPPAALPPAPPLPPRSGYRPARQKTFA